MPRKKRTKKEQDIFDAVAEHRASKTCTMGDVKSVVEVARKEFLATITAEPILLRSNRIINGAKRDEYGPVEQSFIEVAAVWSVILGMAVRPIHVGQMMIAWKMVRLKHKAGSGTITENDDSILDQGGYVGLSDLVKELPAPLAHLYPGKK